MSAEATAKLLLSPMRMAEPQCSGSRTAKRNGPHWQTQSPIGGVTRGDVQLDAHPMAEVPPAVTDERTMRAAALPIRMNAHSRSSIYSSQGLRNQQSAMRRDSHKIRVRPGLIDKRARQASAALPNIGVAVRPCRSFDQSLQKSLNRFSATAV
jgi:hypothetical protein